jgi:hypothetical protein
MVQNTISRIQTSLLKIREKTLTHTYHIFSIHIGRQHMIQQASVTPSEITERGVRYNNITVTESLLN